MIAHQSASREQSDSESVVFEDNDDLDSALSDNEDNSDCMGGMNTKEEEDNLYLSKKHKKSNELDKVTSKEEHGYP